MDYKKTTTTKRRDLNSYQVVVKLLSNRQFNVILGPNDTIGGLKQRIFEREGIPAARQNLLVMGRLLQPDTRQLSEYNLKAGDMVYVTAGVRGPTSFSFGEPLVSKESSGDVKGKLISGDAKGKLVSGAVSGDSKKKPIATPSVITSEVDPVSEMTRLRASTIQTFATVQTVLRPQAALAPTITTAVDPQEQSSGRWPRSTQAYCIYTRKPSGGGEELSGVITFGLSTPVFHFSIGIGIEILLEAPTQQARLGQPMTGATISDSWMFCIVHELAHQCYALGLQIRQLLEKLSLLSVEIAGVQLPQEYVDPATGRCCVLLGHLGDPDVPRGFNITVMHQNQPILQSVVFVTARLLTFAECQLIRKDGSSARHKLAESFVKDRLHICDVPTKLWPNHIATGKEAAAAPALGMPNTALAFPLPSSPPLVSASAAVSSPASAPVSVPASAPVSAPASATTATSSLKAPAPASLSAPAPATSSFKAPAVKAVVV